MRLLEITNCRQLKKQLVENFGYRQASLYISKFFEPNLRNPRMIQTRVVQTTNWIPFSAHFWAYCSYFISSAFVRAKPHLLATSEIRLSCNGEVMVTSNATGFPTEQLDKYMSPGFELLSGIKFFLFADGC